MKRAFALFLALLMCISMVACDGEPAETTAKPTEPSTEPSVPVITENPDYSAEETVEFGTEPTFTNPPETEPAPTEVEISYPYTNPLTG